MDAAKFTTRSREADRGRPAFRHQGRQHPHRADPPAGRAPARDRRDQPIPDRQRRRRRVRPDGEGRGADGGAPQSQWRDRAAAGRLRGADARARVCARPRHVHEGRLRRHRAPAHRAGLGREPRPEAPAGRRTDRRRAARRPHRRPRQPQGHQPGGGVDVRGAREVLRRPDRGSPRGATRPGDRQGRRDQARHPGAVPSYEEQPGADRRARGRQDCGGRGPRPARRGRRRTRLPQGPPPPVARPGRDGGGREVPRRVRGAAQGRARGDQGRRRPDHHVHRRAAHRRRRRRGRRLRHGRRQHAQADAGAWRAAHDRRHDPRRVPRADREGPRAGAPVPAGVRRRTECRGHHPDPAGHPGEVRGAPRRADHRRRARGCRDPVRPLHHRAPAPGQGDRPDRRGRRHDSGWRSSRRRRRSTSSAGRSSG